MHPAVPPGRRAADSPDVRKAPVPSADGCMLIGKEHCRRPESSSPAVAVSKMLVPSRFLPPDYILFFSACGDGAAPGSEYPGPTNEESMPSASPFHIQGNRHCPGDCGISDHTGSAAHSHRAASRRVHDQTAIFVSDNPRSIPLLPELGGNTSGSRSPPQSAVCRNKKDKGTADHPPPLVFSAGCLRTPDKRAEIKAARTPLSLFSFSFFVDHSCRKPAI